MGAERIKELTETGKAVPSARPHRFKNLERPLAPVGRQGRAGRALMRQHKPNQTIVRNPTSPTTIIAMSNTRTITPAQPPGTILHLGCLPAH